MLRALLLLLALPALLIVSAYLLGAVVYLALWLVVVLAVVALVSRGRFGFDLQVRPGYAARRRRRAR
jgi:hypothetical protein